MEDRLGNVSLDQPDRATKLVQEVRELRKQQARIQAAHNSGDAFAIMDRNIRHYYHTMGYEVENDVQKLIEETEAYASKPDPLVYLASSECRLFKNALILSLLAAEYLDFDNVAKKYSGDQGWPQKVATYMSRYKRFTQFMSPEELSEGLNSYFSAGLQLKTLPENFGISIFASHLPSNQDLNQFAKHAKGNSKVSKSLRAYFEQPIDQGGLGIDDEDIKIDFAAVVDYVFWAQSQLGTESKQRSALAALCLAMVDAKSRTVSPSWLLGFLSDQIEASVDKRGHHITSGNDSRQINGRGIKHSNVFDKSSELKLKEEEIPISEGQDHRWSESKLTTDQILISRQNINGRKATTRVYSS